MDNEPNFVSKLLVRFGLVLLGILVVLFVITSLTTGISLFNSEIIKMFVDLFGISVAIVALLTIAIFVAAIFLNKSPVQSTGSMVVKDGALKYEYRDENNKVRKKTINLNNIDKYLNDYKVMNIIDNLKLFKKDRSKKSNAMNLLVEGLDSKSKSLRDLYFEDEDEYNRIGAFLDRISKKDEIDMEFRLRKYVAIDNIINSGQEIIQRLNECKREIRSKEVINGVNEIISDIKDMEKIIDQIDDYDKVRKLYDNYLNMVMDILNNYRNLEKYEKRPEELKKASDQLLQTFALIDSAFEALKSGKAEEKFEELDADVQSLEEITKESVATAEKN